MSDSKLFTDIQDLFYQYENSNKRYSNVPRSKINLNVYSGRKDSYQEDMHQLNVTFAEWLERLQAGHVYTEGLFATWLYLRIKQYREIFLL